MEGQTRGWQEDEGETGSIVERCRACHFGAHSQKVLAVALAAIRWM